jgi:hypothetical protein
VYGLDVLKERRADKRAGRGDAGALPDPVRFSQASIDKFTHAQGLARHFDPDVATNLIHAFAHLRSAVPLASPELGQLGQVYRVLPLQPGHPRLDEVLALAQQNHQVVLGSLSLPLLPTGDQAVMLVIVAQPGSERFAVARRPDCPFAVLGPPVEVKEPPAPQPEVIERKRRRVVDSPPVAESEPEVIDVPAVTLAADVKETNGVAKKPAAQRAAATPNGNGTIKA